MEKKPSLIPKKEDGSYDRDAVRAAFMASPYLDWTRFAEEQGWDPHITRREFSVRTWQVEKRNRLVERQTDILNGLITERKFRWTQDIIDTLDNYPKMIDAAAELAKAKMWQIGEMFKEYVEWRKAGKHIEKMQNGKERRVYHPYEKLSLVEVSMLLKGIDAITAAKLKALMIDKWALKKLDIPQSELESVGQEENNESSGLMITVEGRSDIAFADIQRWFDEYGDKPSLGPGDQSSGQKPPENADTVEVDKPPVQAPHGVTLLDDNGRPIGGEGGRS